MDKSLMERTREAASPHLPPFCTIVTADLICVVSFDEGKKSSREVLRARFTFPGATGPAIWREDLPEMATVMAGDYDTYQRLKEQWRKETSGDTFTLKEAREAFDKSLRGEELTERERELAEARRLSIQSGIRSLDDD